jgi:hypothetical protein
MMTRLSARQELNNQESWGKIPTGKTAQFVNRFAASGWTGEMVQGFLNHPELFDELFDDGKRILERDRYYFPNELTINKQWETYNLRNGDVVDLALHFYTGNQAIIFHMSSHDNGEPKKPYVNSFEWVDLIPGVQIQFRHGENFYIRQLKPGR